MELLMSSPLTTVIMIMIGWMFIRWVIGVIINSYFILGALIILLSSSSDQRLEIVDSMADWGMIICIVLFAKLYIDRS